MTVTRVAWKDEGDFGPLYVFEGDPPAPEEGALGRPYQPKCLCDEPDVVARNRWGHEVCRCGGEVERWTTRAHALAVAAEHGLELEES